MKKLLPAVFCLFCIIPVSAQHRVSLELGMGFPTFSSKPSDDVTNHFITEPKVTIGTNYQRRISHIFCLGVKIFFEQYSFSYGNVLKDTVHNIGGDIVNKSTYLFVAPTLDAALEYRQILHIFVSGAYGMLWKGTQNSHTHSYPLNQKFTDNYYGSTSEIGAGIMRLDFGLSEHIMIDHYWQITFNESFGMLLGQMTTLDNPIYGSTSIHPGCFTLTMGIMRKVYTRWPVGEDD